MVASHISVKVAARNCPEHLQGWDFYPSSGMEPTDGYLSLGTSLHVVWELPYSGWCTLFLRQPARSFGLIHQHRDQVLEAAQPLLTCFDFFFLPIVLLSYNWHLKIVYMCSVQCDVSINIYIAKWLIDRPITFRMHPIFVMRKFAICLLSDFQVYIITGPISHPVN